MKLDKGYLCVHVLYNILVNFFLGLRFQKLKKKDQTVLLLISTPLYPIKSYFSGRIMKKIMASFTLNFKTDYLAIRPGPKTLKAAGTSLV